MNAQINEISPSYRFEEGRLFESLALLLSRSSSADDGIAMEWRPLLDRFMKQHKLSGRVVERNNSGRIVSHRR